MASRAFWPGFNWRLLAHLRPTKHQPEATESYAVYAGERWAGREPHIGDNWELDELVIDHWFHIEQMGVRHWWIGVGSYDEGSDFFHINVEVKGDKTVRVDVEQENKR